MSNSPQILPDLLLLEIFSWLPAATVLRFRCVSKSLNSETRSPSFVLLHLSRVNRQQEREGSDRRLFRYRNYGRTQRQPEPPPLPGVPRELRKKALRNHYCDAVAKGLLLVRQWSSSNTAQPRMLICNPVTGDCTRLLQQDNYAYWAGIVFVPETEEYKVLTVSHVWSETKDATFEFCTMPARSGLPGPWKRILAVVNGDNIKVCHETPAVVVNGRIHLIGNRYLRGYSEQTSTITSFDISDETLREVPIPPVTSIIRWYDARLENLRGSLALLQVESTKSYQRRRHRRRLLVWVMKEYGDGESWMKAFFFEARLPLSTPIVKKHRYCLSTVYLDDKGELVCYDEVERKYKPIRGGLGVKFSVFDCLAPFVGTLVAPKFLNGDHIN